MLNNVFVQKYGNFAQTREELCKKGATPLYVWRACAMQN